MDLRFSLSHSGKRALLAITRGIDVGIDIERIRGDVDVRRLAERFFTPIEARQLPEHGDQARCDEFFRTWARKEALIKALGLGVPSALQRFSVLRQDAGRLVAEPAGGDGDSALAGWTIADLQSPDGYAAAIAVEAEELSLIHI